MCILSREKNVCTKIMKDNIFETETMFILFIVEASTLITLSKLGQ